MNIRDAEINQRVRADQMVGTITEVHEATVQVLWDDGMKTHILNMDSIEPDSAGDNLKAIQLQSYLESKGKKDSSANLMFRLVSVLLQDNKNVSPSLSAELKTASAEADEEATSFRMQIGLLEGQIENSRAEIERLSWMLEQTRTDYESAKNAFAILRKEREDDQLRIEELRTYNRNLEKEVASYEKFTKTHHTEIIADLQQQVAGLIVENQAWKQQAQLTPQLQQTTNIHKIQNTDLKAQLVEAHSMINQFEKHLLDAAMEKEAALKAKAEAESHYHADGQQMAKLLDQNTALRNQVATLQAALKKF